MFKTPVEARDMVCGLAMPSWSSGYPSCCASKCMMWRWWKKGETGYCGLVGIPLYGADDKKEKKEKKQ